VYTNRIKLSHVPSLDMGEASDVTHGWAWLLTSHVDGRGFWRHTWMWAGLDIHRRMQRAVVGSWSAQLNCV